MKKLLFLLLPIFCFSQTAEDYFAKAKTQIEQRNYRGADETISKAIELNPDNLEYRWIKVRSNFLHNANADKLVTVIENLNFIISKGDNSEKTYKNLGLAESLLANEILLIEINSTDNNAEKAKIYQMAISHFEKSKEAYEKAKELNLVTSIEKDIERIKNNISELE